MRFFPVVLVISAVVGSSACGPKAGEDVAQPREFSAAIPVSVSTAVQTEWPSVYEATGTVRAKTAAQISGRVMAYVREVRVRAGDRVRAGQTLVILDAQDLQARERQAEAARNEAQAAAAEADQAIESAKVNLDLAETTFRRMKELFDKRSLSNQEFDEANARVRAARAALDMAQAKRKQLDARIAQAAEEQQAAKVQSGFAELAAPFDGLVTARTVEPGNLAVPGAPLLTIEQQGAYRFEADVEESHLEAVRAGSRVEVKVDSLDRAATGT